MEHSNAHFLNRSSLLGNPCIIHLGGDYYLHWQFFFLTVAEIA